MRLTWATPRLFGLPLSAAGACLAFAGCAVVITHVVLLLGPPLSLTDIFNYLHYGRMLPDHGLNPYVSLPAAASPLAELAIRDPPVSSIVSAETRTEPAVASALAPTAVPSGMCSTVTA